MYHHATVAVLLSRSWRVRKRAQQTVRKLLSSLGGSSLAHGLLGELRVVINKHKVRHLFSSQSYIFTSWLWITDWISWLLRLNHLIKTKFGLFQFLTVGCELFRFCLRMSWHQNLESSARWVAATFLLVPCSKRCVSFAPLPANGVTPQKQRIWPWRPS